MDATPLAELDWFTGDETTDRVLDMLPRTLRRLIAERPRNAVQLSTPRLILRELSVCDFDRIAALVEDREHRRYVLPHQFGSEYARTVVAGALLGPYRAERSHFCLAIETRESGEFMGTCTLAIRGRFARRAFIGWEIARNGSGAGVAVETGRALIDFARHRQRLRAIVVDCDARNEACMAVARRLGLRRVTLGPWSRLAMHRRYAADLPYARFAIRPDRAD